MLRTFVRTAITAALLVLVVPLRADIPPDAGTSASTARRNLPVWEVPSTAVKMGLVSTAILSSTEPEVEIFRSSILPSRLHGNIGEALVNDMLDITGEWKPVKPRIGPQGIDHIRIKFPKPGRRIDILVNETKYGMGRLGMTKDGPQMSRQWISKRLLQVASSPGANPEIVNAHLRAASEGRISYRPRLTRVNVKDDYVYFSVQQLDSDGVAIGPEHSLPHNRISGRFRKSILKGLADEYRKVNPAASYADANHYAARTLLSSKTAQDALSQKSAHPRLLGTGGSIVLSGGLLAGTTDAVAQLLWSDGRFDWSRTGTLTMLGSFSSGSAGAVQLATSLALQKNVAFRTRSIALGRSMGLLPTRTVSLLPKTVGGPVAILAFSYGGYAFDLYDIKEAHRGAIEGLAMWTAGGLAHAGILGIATAWGTASTGTAISTLSGAALNSAQLAWLGGGGGMVWGSAVLWTGVAVAAVAAGAAVWYGFHLYDKAQDWKRVGNTIEVLRNHTGDFPGNPWARPAQAL